MNGARETIIQLAISVLVSKSLDGEIEDVDAKAENERHAGLRGRHCYKREVSLCKGGGESKSRK